MVNKNQRLSKKILALALGWVTVLMGMTTSENVAQAQVIDWTHQFGTAGTDEAFSTTVDSSGVYVTGRVEGALPGQIDGGSWDFFVRKYDPNGNEVWTRQSGASPEDTAYGISVDSTGLYISGFVYGTLPGQTGSGFADVFVRKYDTSGNVVWTRQFGSSASEVGLGISVTGSAVYVAGYTNGTLPGQTISGLTDSFVRKYDINGNHVWTRQFGTPQNDSALGISADPTGVYVSGTTGGTLPGQTSSGFSDAFVRKYDVDGDEVWTRQFGSSDPDSAFGISVASTGLYVAGDGGILPGQPGGGAFVCKYDVDGIEVWTRQFNTVSAGAHARGISVNSIGLFETGWVVGALPGQTSSGSLDAYVRKYNFNGNLEWTYQFGSSGGEEANGISAGPTGVYVAGATTGTFSGQASSGGGWDAFFVKMQPSFTNLAITKLDSPDPVFIGQNLTYTLTVSNTGPDSATNVVLTDTLPPGVGFISAIGSGWSCNHSAGVVTCNRPSLGLGAAPPITITVTAPITTGTITNNANVTGDEFDPNTGNNNAAEVTTVTEPMADLQISKYDLPDPVHVGQNLTYTLTTTNNGPDTATGVTVTDTLPVNVNYLSSISSQGNCSEAGGTVTCNLGNISNGANATMDIVVVPTAVNGHLKVYQFWSRKSVPVGVHSSGF